MFVLFEVCSTWNVKATGVTEAQVPPMRVPPVNLIWVNCPRQGIGVGAVLVPRVQLRVAEEWSSLLKRRWLPRVCGGRLLQFLTRNKLTQFG